MSYWVKFYVEILDDPKMGMLSDHLWRRVGECFLMAKVANKGGLLPDLKWMAYKLHCDVSTLESELKELAEQTNIVKQTEQGWLVVNFEKRQAPKDKTAAERMQRFRERNSNAQDNENITRNITRNVTRREQRTELKRTEDNANIPGLDGFFGECCRFYESKFAPLTPALSETIQGWCDDYPHGWTLDAMKEAKERKARNPKSYITAILKNWKIDGHGTQKSDVPFVPEEHASEVYGEFK